jgi:PH (Pleckstrin Homology) domain-containing protein
LTAPIPSHLATTALVSWLREARAGVVKPDSIDGSITLEFGRKYRITVLVLFVLATLMLAGEVVVFQGELTSLATVGAIFGLVWLGVLYGVYDAFFVTVRASPRGLEAKSPLIGHRTLPWERIEAVTYASTGNWYTFKAAEGWAIRISIYRNGLKSFSALVSSNIGRSSARMTPPSFYAHTT